MSARARTGLTFYTEHILFRTNSIENTLHTTDVVMNARARTGMTFSIDAAYSLVDSDYIFHCQVLVRAREHTHTHTHTHMYTCMHTHTHTHTCMHA